MRTGLPSTRWHATLFIGGLLATSQISYGQRVIFVNHAAGGANNGASWANAYLDLQDALDDAAAGGCPCEVWTAQGTYRPDRGTGDRAGVYVLRNHVALLGGFRGVEECADERDPGAYVTVLSGDLLGNDGDDIPVTSDCCVPHVEYGGGCDNAACEQAVDEVVEGSIDCADEWWFGNCAYAAQYLCCDLCRPTRCDNSYTLLRAEYVDAGAVVDGFQVYGGDPFCSEEVWCAQAGGLWGFYSDLTLRRVVFTGHANRAAMFFPTTNSLIESCVFTDNDMPVGGSDGLEIWGGSARIVDSLFSLNVKGLVIISDRPTVERTIFRDHASSAVFVGGSPNIVDCTFERNYSSSVGGAIDVGLDAPRIRNCVFAQNRAELGAAIFSWAPVVVRDSILIGNRAEFAAAIYALATRLENCTFHKNFAGSGPGAVETAGGSVENCVFADNVGENNGPDYRMQLQLVEDEWDVRANYNAFHGSNTVPEGDGNVIFNPMFLDPDGPDDITGTPDDDLRLSPRSPLINMGDPEFDNDPERPDMDGHARVLCGRVDIGAYEFGIGDYNCDRAVELDDYLGFPDCLTGPAPATPYPSACAAYDFATEIAEDIDLLDFAGFQNAPFSDGT